MRNADSTSTNSLNCMFWSCNSPKPKYNQMTVKVCVILALWTSEWMKQLSKLLAIHFLLYEMAISSSVHVTGDIYVT